MVWIMNRPLLQWCDHPRIRTLLAFAVQNDMIVHQMDVVTAFLNGLLEEDIYMEQPEGYLQPGNEHLVYQLKKFLYGLKQSPRCWNTMLTEFLESNHFKRNTADGCVFVRIVDSIPIVVAVYVDDLIILVKALETMNAAKQFQNRPIYVLRSPIGGVTAELRRKKCSLSPVLNACYARIQ